MWNSAWQENPHSGVQEVQIAKKDYYTQKKNSWFYWVCMLRKIMWRVQTYIIFWLYVVGLDPFYYYFIVLILLVFAIFNHQLLVILKPNLSFCK